VGLGFNSSSYKHNINSYEQLVYNTGQATAGEKKMNSILTFAFLLVLDVL
jgi:hypothetical protein